MSIVLLQAASGPNIDGPVVRIPPGDYSVEKSGSFDSCSMFLNREASIPLNSHVLLSNHASVKLQAENAEDLTIRLIRSV
jgi:hypothetical protein